MNRESSYVVGVPTPPQIWRHAVATVATKTTTTVVVVVFIAVTAGATREVDMVVPVALASRSSKASSVKSARRRASCPSFLQEVRCILHRSNTKDYLMICYNYVRS
jgi:hypothetical protein